MLCTILLFLCHLSHSFTHLLLVWRHNNTVWQWNIFRVHCNFLLILKKWLSETFCCKEIFFSKMFVIIVFLNIDKSWLKMYFQRFIQHQMDKVNQSADECCLWDECKKDDSFRQGQRGWTRDERLSDIIKDHKRERERDDQRGREPDESRRGKREKRVWVAQWQRKAWWEVERRSRGSWLQNSSSHRLL